MPSHAEKRKLPYSAGLLFDIVADIENYPKFLPWCVAARINSRDGNVLLADMVIGFKMIRERYTSKVILGDGRIDVSYYNGPFKYMNNCWFFETVGENETIVDFNIDFEFRSRLLKSVMNPLFNEAVRLVVGAFEKRAWHLCKYVPEKNG